MDVLADRRAPGRRGGRGPRRWYARAQSAANGRSRRRSSAWQLVDVDEPHVDRSGGTRLRWRGGAARAHVALVQRRPSPGDPEGRGGAHARDAAVLVEAPAVVGTAVAGVAVPRQPREVAPGPPASRRCRWGARRPSGRARCPSPMPVVDVQRHAVVVGLVAGPAGGSGGRSRGPSPAASRRRRAGSSTRPGRRPPRQERGVGVQHGVVAAYANAPSSRARRRTGRRAARGPGRGGRRARRGRSGSSPSASRTTTPSRGARPAAPAWQVGTSCEALAAIASTYVRLPPTTVRQLRRAPHREHPVVGEEAEQVAGRKRVHRATGSTTRSRRSAAAGSAARSSASSGPRAGTSPSVSRSAFGSASTRRAARWNRRTSTSISRSAAGRAAWVLATPPPRPRAPAYSRPHPSQRTENDMSDGWVSTPSSANSRSRCG